MFTLTHVPQNKQWIEMNYSRPLSEKSENIKENIKYKYIIFLRLAFIGKVIKLVKLWVKFEVFRVSVLV